MAPKVDPAAQLARVAKLLEVAKDLHGKQQAVLDEIDALLAGKAGIGAKMKQVQTAFDDAWCVRYAPGQTGAYVWAMPGDGKLLKDIIRKLGPDECAARAVRYVMGSDPFFSKNRHSFRLFVHSINQWAAAADAPPDHVDEEVAGELQQTASRRRALYS